MLCLGWPLSQVTRRMNCVVFRVAAESSNKENEDPDYDNLHSDDSSSDEEVLYDDRFGKLPVL